MNSRDWLQTLRNVNRRTACAGTSSPGFTASYYSLRRFIARLRRKSSLPVRRLETQGEHLQPCDAAGPGEKVRPLLELVEFLPEDQVGLLEHVFCRLRIAQQREDIPKHPRLVPGEKANEPFDVLGRG